MVHIFFLVILFFTIPDMNKKFPFWFFSFSFLFLFSALRYDFGTDYMEYYNIHHAIQNGYHSWGQSDWLFRFLNLLIPNFFVLIALLSALHVYALYNLIRNNLQIRQYWFALLILMINPYLFLVQQSSIRQTAAISIVILAINYGIKRKLINYCILIFLASGFHASATIMFPVYFFLTEKKLRKKGVILILTIVSVLLFTPTFDILINKVLEFLPRHYALYYEQGLQNTLRSTLISSVFFMVVLLNINKLEGKELIYGKLSLIATIISIMAIKVSMITRIGMYFDVFLIITIPQIFNKMDKKLYKQLLFILLISIYILRYYSFFSHPSWSRAYGIYKTILGR